MLRLSHVTNLFINYSQPILLILVLVLIVMMVTLIYLRLNQLMMGLLIIISRIIQMLEHLDPRHQEIQDHPYLP